MIYLLWGLLNIALFLFFIVVCFKATKLIREKIGRFAMLIFVFGLVSFIGHSNDENQNLEPNSNQIKTWKFTPEDSLNRNGKYSLNIHLENTLVSKYQLGIKYGKDRQRETNVPISAYSSTTGFVSGTNWKPISIVVHTTDHNNKFEYHVFGVVEWKILGATLYSEEKEFNGIALTK